MNILVESGVVNSKARVECEEGLNVDLLLEKILLEAELLDLKANPNKKLREHCEATLTRSRICCTVLVLNGTLKIGDLVFGSALGRVKAMFMRETKSPKKLLLRLGFDTWVNVLRKRVRNLSLCGEAEAKEVAIVVHRFARARYRTKKHITLDEIGVVLHLEIQTA